MATAPRISLGYGAYLPSLSALVYAEPAPAYFASDSALVYDEPLSA